MIRTRFATVEPTSWGCITRFDDGASVPSQHFPDDPTHFYPAIAMRCGYGFDTLRYCIEHEVAHLTSQEVLHNRPSPVLWRLAHGDPMLPHEAIYEEMAAQALQRFARTNERPIIGGCDWDAMRARFEEVLQ